MNAEEAYATLLCSCLPVEARTLSLGQGPAAAAGHQEGRACLLLRRNRISPDPIFLAVGSESTGGFYAINRCGWEAQHAGMSAGSQHLGCAAVGNAVVSSSYQSGIQGLDVVRIGCRC
jgi:hypothetical protein